mgnify:FL=1
MPLYQMQSAMSAQLGADWRSKFAEFDDKPFAAASIGQVRTDVMRWKPYALFSQHHIDALVHPFSPLRFIRDVIKR